MRKIIFVFLLLFTFVMKGQKIDHYKYVSICHQDGMYRILDNSKEGKQAYVSYIKDFEMKLAQTKDNFSTYYRVYYFYGKPKPTELYITLIPKNIIKQDVKQEIAMFPTKKGLEIRYDLETKEISKPRPHIVLPDL